LGLLSEEIEFRGGILIDLRQKMAVVVVGEGDRTVTGASSDLGGINPGRGKKSNPGVFECVRSEGCQPGGINSSPPRRLSPLRWP
jgi:hypothetical protein